MIPFSHTWPYDIIYGDLYVQSCPFCSRENVLLPMKPKELQLVRDGKKASGIPVLQYKPDGHR